jgi:methylated-DNA-[protein]-cysteine S-methyltransferase
MALRSAAPVAYTFVDSPVGPLRLVRDGDALAALYMDRQRHAPTIGPAWERDDGAAVFGQAAEQLDAYFGGDREAFDLPLAPHGTAFQQRVWSALQAIGYGETTTYAALAVAVGNPRAVRAVGLANGRNPISVIIPCHRVVGSDGSLTGYGGGLERKRFLLDHERGRLALAPPTPVAAIDPGGPTP